MELILIFLGCTLMGFIASRITQRNARDREFARQLGRAVAPGCRHPDDQMVPVTALAGDIVAALCGECDEQLELALWQARCDRELQALDAPEPIKVLEAELATAVAKISSRPHSGGSRFQRVAEQLGIPYDPNESAHSFDRRVRKAMDQEKKEIEVIRATEELVAKTEQVITQFQSERKRLWERELEPQSGWMYSDFRATGWYIKEIIEPMGSFGFVEVVLFKDGLFYRRPLTREAYEIWYSR
jgi:hypothetical protein